jgi:hypothetical protein
MQIPKDQIINLLRERGSGDQASQADAQLPDQVDHEEHGGLLQQLGLDPNELLGRFGSQQSGAGSGGQAGEDPGGGSGADAAASGG